MTERPVTLREITAETVRSICALAVRPDQQKFVAPVAISISQAHFAPEAWFRAIYAGDEPVGFVMLSLKPEVPEYFLWRYMVDARHQGKGYGAEALRQVIAMVREMGATEFLTSCVPGEGSPRDFYLGLGFEDTGRVEDDEIVLRLPLVPAEAPRA
jgi:diamine N-acetyltransferase